MLECNYIVAGSDATRTPHSNGRSKGRQRLGRQACIASRHMSVAACWTDDSQVDVMQCDVHRFKGLKTGFL